MGPSLCGTFAALTETVVELHMTEAKVMLPKRVSSFFFLQEGHSLWHVGWCCRPVPCQPYGPDQGADANGWEEEAGRVEAKVMCSAAYIGDSRLVQGYVHTLPYDVVDDQSY